ncbi:MAG: hypothetical protein EP343_10260 [Deltaproteobacteria bacterium]|nr:MAG: hypothetical protein EP343_10260 [Deltaproteobacteria bacterium]
MSKVQTQSSKDNQQKSSKSGQKRHRKRQKQLEELEKIERLSLPEYVPPEPEEEVPLEAREDDFGNQMNYVSKHGEGIDGIYREPMDGGTTWSHTRHHRRRNHNLQESHEDGILTMRQPGWKDRVGPDDEANFRNDETTPMTVRQQPDLSKSLQYDKDANPSAQLSRYEQGKDPAKAWQLFMRDLKKGRVNTRKIRAEEKRKRRERNQDKAKE